MESSFYCTTTDTGHEWNKPRNWPSRSVSHKFFQTGWDGRFNFGASGNQSHTLGHSLPGLTVAGMHFQSSKETLLTWKENPRSSQLGTWTLWSKEKKGMSYRWLHTKNLSTDTKVPSVSVSSAPQPWLDSSTEPHWFSPFHTRRGLEAICIKAVSRCSHARCHSTTNNWNHN